MRLIACPSCRTQFDVETLAAPSLQCRCGAEIAIPAAPAADAAVLRCGSCGAGVSPADPLCAWCGSQIERDERRRSQICPECYARCADDARFCTACGVAFRPEALPGDAPSRSCPVCEVPLHAQQIAGVDLAECGGCRGLWVPGSRFETLIDRVLEARRKQLQAQAPVPAPRVSSANPVRQDVRYLRCPSCAEQMSRRNFRKSSGVILDLCRRCGTWLDGDELEAVAGFLLRGGETSPVIRDEAARADAAIERIRARAPRSRDFDARAPVAPSLAELLSSVFD